ncbi:FAD-binding oxidoreductase [Nonomuraea typhae]|uniref:FAD-binding oxidoreductase n=1 Tax=Nonomuraea typhae TaxID=2603600 RepID=UPI0012F8A87A|nr:FAD-binding oxidoreductase [Nonomuraea typhae]
MLWSGWGDPAKARELPETVRKLLHDLLGVRAPGVPAATLESVRLAPPRLPAAVLAALGDVTGAGHVSTAHEDRVRHAGGKSTPDLLRMRAGDGAGAPDAVVSPGDHDEVAEVLRVCAEARVAVVPFGGGTSVVGALTPALTPGGAPSAEGAPAPEGAPSAGGVRDTRFAGVVALDLGRLNRLLGVDAESMIATFEPGVRAPEAERMLGEQGLTLGHFPQSFEYATLGGFAAARSSGQASAGYGRFDDMVVGLTLATPTGTLELGRAPKSAAGPDLRQLVLGSEGAFGVITALRLRVRRAPAVKVYEGWRFASFAEGGAALRALAQHGPLPTVLRLSDETETMIGLAKPEAIGGGDSGCLVIAGYEGTDEGPGAEVTGVSARRRAAGRVLAGLGGTPLGEEPGEAWAHGRFSAPYLRDSLLAEGATVETLETAGFWAGLPRLYDAVRLALLGALGSPLVMCHISHVYESGASLYFTVVTAQKGDPIEQWERAKEAVSEAIVAAGGTISHHHGVGRDHRDAYAREIGPLGTEILRAVKERLDPAGIMNPGALVTP